MIDVVESIFEQCFNITGFHKDMWKVEFNINKFNMLFSIKVN